MKSPRKGDTKYGIRTFVFCVPYALSVHTNVRKYEKAEIQAVESFYKQFNLCGLVSTLSVVVEVVGCESLNGSGVEGITPHECTHIFCGGVL